MQKVGRNVATSQRRDIPTSRHRANENGSQQAANVMTLQHRDVSMIFASPSLKEKGIINQGE